MQGPSKAGMARDGFSIIEVILALVILSIVVLGAMAVGVEIQSVEVVSEADILRAHLGYVQMLAMANNTVQWSILFGGSSYSLCSNSAVASVKFPGEASAVHSLPSGVAIVSGSGTLSLDSWGAPPADYLVTLSAGNHQEQVSILGFTGLIQ